MAHDQDRCTPPCCCPKTLISTKDYKDQCPASYVWQRCLQASWSPILLWYQAGGNPSYANSGTARGCNSISIVSLASAHQRLQQSAMELGEDFAADIVLALTELDSPASACLGYELRLEVSTFNSLSEKRKVVVLKSWVNKSELVDIVNREFPPCLDSLLKWYWECCEQFLQPQTAVWPVMPRKSLRWTYPATSATISSPMK